MTEERVEKVDKVKEAKQEQTDLIHTEERRQCRVWQAYIALTSSQGGMSWMLRIKWLITTGKTQQRNNHIKNKGKNQFDR